MKTKSRKKKLTPGQAAVKAINAIGSAANLARALLPAKYTYKEHIVMCRRISHWRRTGVPTRDRMVLRVEEITGVSRHELAPDIYPMD